MQAVEHELLKSGSWRFWAVVSDAIGKGSERRVSIRMMSQGWHDASRVQPQALAWPSLALHRWIRVQGRGGFASWNHQALNTIGVCAYQFNLHDLKCSHARDFAIEFECCELGW